MINFIDDSNWLARGSISYTREGWKDLVQRVLNNHLKIEHTNLSQEQIINEYKIEEHERIYRIKDLCLFRLPSQETIKSIVVQIGSVLRYATVHIQLANMMIIPLVLQDRIGREQSKSATQKRVTIIPPNNLIDKQRLLVQNDSSKRRSSVDARRSSSDDLRQIILNAIRRYSSQDEPLPSTSFIRKRQQNSVVSLYHDNYSSRLSRPSISYGFGLGTRTSKTIQDQKQIQEENRSSTSMYRLLANKIELDRSQHDITHLTAPK